MNFGLRLLVRFGLVAQRPEGPDTFDLRLQRIGMREQRRQARSHLFKSLLQPLEDAALS